LASVSDLRMSSRRRPSGMLLRRSSFFLLLLSYLLTRGALVARALHAPLVLSPLVSLCAVEDDPAWHGLGRPVERVAVHVKAKACHRRSKPSVVEGAGMERSGLVADLAEVDGGVEDRKSVV